MHDDDKFFGFVAGLGLVALVAQLIIWGVLIWAIVKIVQAVTD